MEFVWSNGSRAFLTCRSGTYKISYLARNASHIAANWPSYCTSRSNEYWQKSQKKIVQATQLSSLEEPRPPRWRTIMLLMSFRLVFLLGKSVRATSWRKTPKLALTSCFSVSAQTSLKRYSERLLLFELSSSLSRIDDIIVNFGEKMRQPAHCTETQRRLFTFTP